MRNDTVYTVSQVNQYIKELLDGNGTLSGIYIRGEISNYKMYPSGHHYFSLKDEGGAIRCVMFRREASTLRFCPENGMKVVAFGRVTVFPRDGQYQLYVNALTPDGVGDLYVAFEQLKAKLFAEGLFDPDQKKPITHCPRGICSGDLNRRRSGAGYAAHPESTVAHGPGGHSTSTCPRCGGSWRDCRSAGLGQPSGLG